MSVKVENLEKNMAKLTIEVDAEQVEKALNKAYNRQKKNISIPGFRKGKVPRQMVEKMYGPEVFYDDAANFLIQDSYADAYDESGLEIVSQPKVEVVQIEKGQPFIYTAEVAVKPEVKLGNYKGVVVTKVDTEVSDEELQDAIMKELENNSRIVDVTDRPVEDGDIANIDFEGFVDGKAFDGGKGEAHPLAIGSGQFIPGFEEQLIGHSIDEEVDVNVTFPEDYHVDDLAGKPALFKVKINSISVKEIPELDQETAEDAGFDSIDEYKEDIKKNLKETKEKNAKLDQEDEAVRKIVEDSEMEIPDAMVDYQVDNMIRDMARNMQMQGISMPQYLQMMGMTMEQMRTQTRPNALARIQSSLVLEAIAEAEGIEATDEDLDKEIEKMASMYYMKAEEIKENMGEEETENMKKDIQIQKAADFVVENADPQDKPKKRREEGEEEE